MADRPLALYVHIPFCLQKCYYCDFASFAYGIGREQAMDRYMAKLLEEIGHRGRSLGKRAISSLYVGGGTPSLLPVSHMEELMEALAAHFGLDGRGEYSLEANPATVDGEKLRAYRRMGFNRISLGVQSFWDRELAALGRAHRAYDARLAYAMARDAGFDNVNLDLIYGLPGQRLGDWLGNLDQALGLDPPPEHISAYGLMVEEQTPFGRWQREGRLVLPEEDVDLAMARMTVRRLEAAGLARYEISNYARPGRECAHNLAYWDRSEYLGLGLGAASLVGERRFSNPDTMEAYLELGWPDMDMEPPLSERERREEYIFLGLRRVEGICLDDFEAAFGCGIEKIYEGQVAKLAGEGLLSVRKGRMALTDRGLELANSCMAQFM